VNIGGRPCPHADFDVLEAGRVLDQEDAAARIAAQVRARLRERLTTMVQVPAQCSRCAAELVVEVGVWRSDTMPTTTRVYVLQ
jgi:hypothetical protein